MVDQKTCLIVIDGWGIPSEKSPKDGDAIAAAETPFMDDFSKEGSPSGREVFIQQADANVEGGLKNVEPLFVSEEAKKYKAPFEK